MERELRFHFEDLCNNLIGVLRKLNYGPCSFLMRGVDYLGEDITIDKLAERTCKYLRDAFQDGIYKMKTCVKNLDIELSSFKGKAFPFIWQVGVEDLSQLYELCNAYRRSVKELSPSIQRIHREVKGKRKLSWENTSVEMHAISDFFSDLADYVGFMFDVYSNQVNVAGVYIGIIGLAASLLGIGVFMENLPLKSFIIFYSLVVILLFA